MSTIESVIQKHTITNYGDLIVPEKPIFNELTKKWKVRLSSTYPRLIEDEESKETIVSFLDLRDLGLIELDENFKILKATDNESCNDRLSSRIDLWKHESEKIVISASADVFAKIGEGIHVLNPLWQILGVITKLQKKDHGGLLDYDEVDQQRRPEKIRQYLDLLIELGIVKEMDDGITYGNTYAGLLEASDNKSPHELQTILLSHVIRSKYSTLRQVFGITQLEPFVHLANVYYWPSLDAGKLIHTTRSHLYQKFQEIYSRVTSWDFDSKLDELTNNGALHYENGYLIGDKTQFDAMLELKQQVVLNP